ncbi:hypothetical protein BVI434_440035 [Burkholderia vietnamiensis]|nr:hypothetical protein BVI434_440035 [Burkholderia vietnamiensis]
MRGFFKIFSQKGLHCEGRVHRITPLSRYRKRGAGEEGKRCGWVVVMTQAHTKLNPSPSRRSSSKSC